MPLIEYDDVYKRALSRVNDLDLINMSEDDFYDFMKEWLHSAIAVPRLRKSFSSFSADDELATINFSLTNSIDTEYDKNFVINILAKGMIVNYLPSKIESTQNLAKIVGGKEEKILTDNYKTAQERLSQLDVEYKRELAQHTYYFGDYGV